MLGHQQTGAIEGAIISAVSHEGLKVTVNGQPAKLAIVTADGKVFASGDAVAKEAMAVVVNSHRNMWMAQGYLRVVSNPLGPDPAAAQDKQMDEKQRA